MMNELIIKIHDLTYSYGSKNPVLKNVSINVPRGCIYGFLGPNGAGKSTTMQLLTGILQSEKGSIEVFGREINQQMPQVFQRMGTLVESPALYLHLSGIDNLRCITTLKGVDERKIPEVLKTVGLENKGNLKVKKYSLGMKQRLAIAMTLLGDPELLLLDEPVNGLDPTGITEVRELLVKLNKEHGFTIFISSHLLSEIEKMCSHIGIIHHGEIKFEGTMQELELKSSKHRVHLVTADVAMQVDILKRKYPGAVVVNEEEISLQLENRSKVPELARYAVENNIPIYQLRLEDNLENWFLSLTNNAS
ncbi:MAG: ABC transporter ATP-binding protein [Nonlabens sp.]